MNDQLDEEMSEYLEDLARFREKRNSARSPSNRRTLPVFLTIRDDIAASLDAGYSKKTIWEHMHETGRAPFRYETFLKHVKAHIPKKRI